MINKMLEVGDIIRWVNDPPERNFLITEVQTMIEDLLDDYAIKPARYYGLDLSTNIVWPISPDEVHDTTSVTKVA